MPAGSAKQLQRSPFTHNLSLSTIVQICQKEHRALYDLNEKEHVDALHLQIRAEAAVREEVEVAEASVSVTRLG